MLTTSQEQRTASVNQRTTFKSDIYALGCKAFRVQLMGYECSRLAFSDRKGNHPARYTQ